MSTSSASYDALTQRQTDVMELMAEGFSNAGIAARLFVGERCVEKHVTEILWKLGLFSRADPTVNRRVTAVLRYQEAQRG